MSAKPRQRSEISLSLASVLVISANWLHVVLERVRQRLRGGLALLRRAVLQQIERRLDGERLAQHLEAQIGDRGVEQPVPGGIGRHRFFVEQLLDAILELIGPVAAHVLEPRPVMAERRIGHRRFEQRVVDAVELEREEQEDASTPRSAAPARRRRIWCAPDRRYCRHAGARHRSRAARSDRRSLHSGAPLRRAPRRPSATRASSASLPL